MLGPTAPVRAALGFVRHRSTLPHPKRPGVRLGVFAAVNTLGKQGQLSEAEEAFRVRTNAWCDANLSLPTAHRPDLYTEACWQAEAWFSASAQDHLARLPGHLRILEAHGLLWQELRSDSPGEVLCEDQHQVVVRPWGTSLPQPKGGLDRPFPSSGPGQARWRDEAPQGWRSWEGMPGCGLGHACRA